MGGRSVLIFAAGILVLVVLIKMSQGGSRTVAQQPTEGYRLVEIVQGNEVLVTRGLSKGDCDSRLSEMRSFGDRFGIYGIAAGYDSLVCRSESGATDTATSEKRPRVR